MLPENIANFVNRMLTETRQGSMTWSYNSNDDLVNTNYNGIYVSLDYMFDYDNEVGLYRLNIIQSGKNFFFPVNQHEYGYSLLKTLYLEAQASDFKF
ncbi:MULTISPECIES: hypothetical protein [unclassified Brenneria]|uniref:hypothetical protein n=1 Tax=unclassified Brenneria TaxID=2634434 RepID=UPI001552472B|nr:hypothetical protein [Brenneria sp. hezel4-2-4]MEE3649897.1 hypothetical protein [Brenneria sp. HEZEL_4_2_4]NPC99855.1 hypothetical protein [Brenneria sp. hezel4-2-4]